MATVAEQPTEVESWAVEGGRFLVNGKVFPHWVAADPGPLVEAIDEHMHILWLPLFANGPAPSAGRPRGEPASETHTPTPRESATSAADGGEEDR